MSKYAGWRFFKCDSCGKHWKESCRDYSSPSSSICPNEYCDSHMNGGVTPYQSIHDPSLPTDPWGNLTSDIQIILLPSKTP